MTVCRTLAFTVVIALLSISPGSATRRAASDDATRLFVVHVARHAKTPPVRELNFIPAAGWAPDGDTSTQNSSATTQSSRGGGGTDPDLQTVYPSSASPIVGLSFDGISWNSADLSSPNTDKNLPPDSNVAVGTTQVVEVANAEFAVFDKGNGALTPGYPVPLVSLFASLGPSDPCVAYHGGDPIVLYDQIAGRWLVNHLVFATGNICIAVSATSDATGAFYVYDFPFPHTPDYPKFGIWSDGYYFSSNSYDKSSGAFVGADACAFDRSMLTNGLATSAVCFQNSSKVFSLLPSGLDGALLPPTGSPDFFLQLGANALSLFKFHVDFATPSQSTFIGPMTIGVGKFTNAGSIPQPGTTNQLPSTSDRVMYRLSYRNFGAYESLLVNHTVQVAGSSSQTGLRWYELRNPNGAPVVYQQSTFSPDATYRWMGSLAQDKQGNMLLEYSASSSSVFPAIRFTGRFVTDPPNEMQHESVIQAGFGSQTPTPNASSGWGDYSSVSVDPVDGCTFWFVNEYLPYTGYSNWVTHIASAKFGGCS
jgi:hypothetical protein